MSALTIPCPAKINLFLAITGRRADGFHELVSVVAPLDWGDTLKVEVTEEDAGSPEQAFSLTCGDPAVPVDGTNLVLKAAQAFRGATGWKGEARFALEKRVPVGAGLGGGSSDAAGALRGLNRLAGEPLGREALAEVAARVGSDVALFLEDGAVAMRGRGERVTRLPDRVRARLRGREILVFKPAFGISTAWAYGRMAAEAPGSYLPAEEAEARLAGWIESGRDEDLLFNNMEPVARRKFPALPVLWERLEREFGLRARMSGSGSACWAFLDAATDVAAATAAIRRGWGESAFLVRARLQ